MRIAIAGAGPAGCAAALSIRRRLGERADIRVYEKGPRDQPRGFGLVLPSWLIDRLAHQGQDWAAELEPATLSWGRIAVLRDAERVVVDGHPLRAISRRRLLAVLRRRMEAEGIAVSYGTPVRPGDRDADLVIAADGADSAFRGGVGVLSREPPSGARYVWFATDAVFPELTFAFRRTEWGVFVAHAYAYAGGESAFIVEAADRTWQDALRGRSAAALCQATFAAELAGARLRAEHPTVRAFEAIRMSRWSTGRIVLVGDAAHTAHFSIGSGTSLAFADAAALADALAEQPSIARALTVYEEARRPPVEIAQALSRQSSRWFAAIDDRWSELDALGLARSLASRTGLAGRVRGAARAGQERSEVDPLTT